MCIMDLLAVVVFCFRMLWLSKNDTDVFPPFVALTIWIRFQIKSEQKTVMWFFCPVGDIKSFKVLLSEFSTSVVFLYLMRFMSSTVDIAEVLYLLRWLSKLRDPRLPFGRFANQFLGEGSHGSSWHPETKD